MFWTRPPVPGPAPHVAASERKTITVEHEGVTHRVLVKSVATARRLTLRVRSADGIAVLTMPPRASLKSAQAFAERHAEWIGTRLAALPDRILLQPGTILPLRGIDHRLVLDPTTLRRCQAGLNPEGEPLLRLSPRAADPAGTVLQFLMAEARRDLVAAVARHAAAVGKPVARITLARHPIALGVLLVARGAELLLAADPGAAPRARLSRRPRSGASRPHGPFGQVLGRDPKSGARDRCRRSLAQAPRARATPLRTVAMSDASIVA